METPEKPGSASAAVVGGGIVGLACALHLQLRGIATQLIDPDESPRGASWGNAGHLAVEQVEPLASLKTLSELPKRLFWRGGAVSLRARDLPVWLPFGWRLLRASGPSRFLAGTAALRSIQGAALPAWRRLAEAAGVESLIVEDGHYVVWETIAGARAGRAHWERADIGGASLSELTREEVARLTALTTSAPADAIRFNGTGRVLDPGELIAGLAQAFTARGGAIHRGRVQELRVEKTRARLALGEGWILDADAIVIAAGIGSAELLRPLGYRVPIIAERGYHIQSDVSDWPDMPPVVFEERSMIVSRFRSGLRAAGFIEFGDANSPPDARKWRRLRAHAAELRLPFRAPVHEWMGARPTLPDYLPAIGRSRRADNLIYAFGHQHLGLTLASITGEIVGALAAGAEAAVDLRPFALERFL